jgi:hypothetical protein
MANVEAIGGSRNHRQSGTGRRRYEGENKSSPNPKKPLKIKKESTSEKL